MQEQIGLGIEYIGVDDTSLDLFESQYRCRKEFRIILM